MRKLYQSRDPTRTWLNICQVDYRRRLQLGHERARACWFYPLFKLTFTTTREHAGWLLWLARAELRVSVVGWWGRTLPAGESAELLKRRVLTFVHGMPSLPKARHGAEGPQRLMGFRFLCTMWRICFEDECESHVSHSNPRRNSIQLSQAGGHCRS